MFLVNLDTHEGPVMRLEHFFFLSGLAIGALMMNVLIVMDDLKRGEIHE